MKILIAPDSFKDSLSAKEVAKSLQRGISKSMPDAEFRLVPVADGGEGTMEAIVDATRGKIIYQEVKDPLGRPHKARFGMHGDGKTAIIEMSSASGIELLDEKERNPWETTTYGTGQLIRAAIEQGCESVIIGIGGSATNDAGMGMARALGVKFLDADGQEIPEGGGALGRLSKVDLSGIMPEISEIDIQVACDVSNPLTGPQGASYIYGPQKGADKEMVKQLDKNLSNFASVIQQDLNMEISDFPGAGAAGGLGAGLMAFTGAKLKPGFDIVKEATALDSHVEWSDCVITGEGKIDHQTQYGKTPMGVATVAAKYNKPVIAVAGTLGEGYTNLYQKGFDAIFSILDKPMALKEALQNASQLLSLTGEAIGGMLAVNQKKSP